MNDAVAVARAGRYRTLDFFQQARPRKRVLGETRLLKARPPPLQTTPPHLRRIPLWILHTWKRDHTRSAVSSQRIHLPLTRLPSATLLHHPSHRQIRHRPALQVQLGFRMAWNRSKLKEALRDLTSVFYKPLLASWNPRFCRN
jgi:hypothetical protein